MKKIAALVLILVLVFFCIDLFAQTTSTRTSTSTGSSRTSSLTSRTGTGSTSGYNNTTGSADFVISAIAGMLRHRDKEVRMQALQALVGGMTLGTTTTSSSSTTTTGIGDIFGMRGGGTTTSSSSSTSVQGLGTTVLIPEFFTMLSDPDPEIRDLVSIALDQIFGTDASLIRFLHDPDPVVRKYAMRLFVIRTREDSQYRTTTSSSSTTYTRSANDILIIRILLNMMKDPDPDVKKVATDALEKFISDLEKRYESTMGTGQPGAQQPLR